MKCYAIIVAGGKGDRMQSEIPKQFLLLAGKPILMHSIDAFANHPLKPEIIVVLNVDYHSHWEKLVRQFDFQTPHLLVKGGSTRFHSVRNGLEKIPSNSLVAIHDAVRPLVADTTISAAFGMAEQKGSAVSAVPCKDSLRKSTANGTESVHREDFYLVQTPQVFMSDPLKKAYLQDYRNEFTDDAAVAERSGVAIHLCEGSHRNIKITWPEDLVIAEALLLNGDER